MSSRGAGRGDGPGVAAGLTGTLVVHAGALALLWATVRPVEAGPPVYAVELVAAPAPAPEVKPAPEVTPRPPAEPPPAPKPQPKPKPAPPKPAAPKPAPIKPPERTEPNPKTTPPTAPLPGETPSTGNDAVTVSTPGLQFPFPEYLRNIVQEVYRRWDRPQGITPLRAEVSFLILRDGSVREIKLTRPSGSFSFDLSAQGAIEAAGTSHAFGPLPDGYPADVLPVSFFFTPRSQ
ncbi:MAG TPA: TonB C-terminal domain-containing protein [Gemmatimonadales bacterium]|nr:TonB C-terminal domain-containing protein [Gemmatimonadales bacterium]